MTVNNTNAGTTTIVPDNASSSQARVTARTRMPSNVASTAPEIANNAQAEAVASNNDDDNSGAIIIGITASVCILVIVAVVATTYFR